jgi:hypothetical protein
MVGHAPGAGNTGDRESPSLRLRRSFLLADQDGREPIIGLFAGALSALAAAAGLRLLAADHAPSRNRAVCERRTDS